MRPSPIATTIASVFIVLFGIACVYMGKFSHVQPTQAKISFIAGLILIPLGIAGFLINRS